MRTMDLNDEGIVFVAEQDGSLVGSITARKIRQIIRDGGYVGDAVSKFANPATITGKVNMADDELLGLNPNGSAMFLPVLDADNKLTEVVELPGKKAPKRIMVTGAAGYIGSILARKLLDLGYEVVIFDDLIYGNTAIADLEHPSLTVVKGDLKHVEDITAALDGVDSVVHLAGIVGDPACALHPLTTLEQNVHSTATLASICKYHQINRFVFASSCSVYGTGDEILTEESDLNPVSLYARDKINSENVLKNLKDENFAPTFMRMGTIFGLSPRPRFDLAVNVLTAFAVRTGKFTIFGGDQWRPFVHVEDAATSYIKALQAPIENVHGEVFNVGSNGQNWKIEDVGYKLKELMPHTEMVISGEDTDKRDYRVNFDKITNVLGFEITKTVEDGIREFEKFLIENEDVDFRDAYYSNLKGFKEALQKKEVIFS
ncbi:MAG: NAD-dependent epimerase/dehydratase family protein [Bacteroidota bacterium]